MSRSRPGTRRVRWCVLAATIPLLVAATIGPLATPAAATDHCAVSGEGVLGGGEFHRVKLEEDEDGSDRQRPDGSIALEEGDRLNVEFTHTGPPGTIELRVKHCGSTSAIWTVSGSEVSEVFRADRAMTVQIAIENSGPGGFYVFNADRVPTGVAPSPPTLTSEVAHQALLEDPFSTDAPFGDHVAVAGDAIAVGSRSGDGDYAAFFEREASSWSGETWRSTAGDQVAMDGDTAVVYDPADGTAEIFVRDGGWVHEQTLHLDWPAKTVRDSRMVAVQGDKIVLGAPHDRDDPGAAVVYTRGVDGWTKEQVLLPGAEPGSHREGLGSFGSSVAVEDGTIVVGAPELCRGTVFERTRGAAYVFTRHDGRWRRTQTLRKHVDADAPDVGGRCPVAFNGGSDFGSSVDVSDGGNTITVGAPKDDTVVSDAIDPREDVGSVYTYHRAGPNWAKTQRLLAVDGQPGDRFGGSVAVDGDVLVAGAEPADAAYVFVRAGGSWVELDRLHREDDAGDGFATSVDVDGSTIVVGAPPLVHVYRVQPGALLAGSGTP